METEPVELEAFAWDELEERYRNAMAAQDAAVKQADEEFGKMLTVQDGSAFLAFQQLNSAVLQRVGANIDFRRQPSVDRTVSIDH